MKDTPDTGAHQNIARATAVLDLLAKSSADGMRLTDVVQASGLGKGTVHRTLSGLVAHGLAELDSTSGRFFVGMRIFSWSASAHDRFGLARLSEASLLRLVRSLDDTVYLSLRSGDETYCLDRREGTFPIKTLTMSAGDRRPLGLTAGGLAILASLPEAEIARIVAAQDREKVKRPFDKGTLHEMVARTRRAGFAYYDAAVLYGAETIRGMAAVAVPIRRADGEPIGALSIAAITDRLQLPRRNAIATQLKNEAARIEAQLPAASGSPPARKAIKPVRVR